MVFSSSETIAPKQKIKKIESNKEDRGRKRDRKNVVKNFVKAFRAFFNCVVDDEIIKNMKNLETDCQLQAFRIKFEKWISSKNFNNSLIVDIIMS